MEVVGIAPSLSILELGILLNLPAALPLPVALDRQEDALLWELDRALFVTPSSSLMWKKSFLEDSHPDSLVLVSLEFSQLFVFLRSVTRLWDAED